MSWSTEYPTKPGFYWIRNFRIQAKTYDGPDIVGKADSFEFYFTSSETLFDERDVDSAEWQGPIEPESETEKEAALLWPETSLRNIPRAPFCDKCKGTHETGHAVICPNTSARFKPA